MRLRESQSRKMNEMERTALNAGIEIMGKHKAAKLLALCMAFGDEPFVFDEKLYKDTMIAAEVCGIGPMRKIDFEAVKLINRYYHSLKNGASWVSAINAQYGTTFKNQIEDDGRGKLLWQSMRT